MNGPRVGSAILCLAGDVMTGRGVDQALACPVDPFLLEPDMPSALHYLQRARRQSGGPLGPVAMGYPWGNLKTAVDAFAPCARIANLETAITGAGQPWPGKRYHFRMSPANAECLKAMGFDVLSLANNHVMDWGPGGLADTVAALDRLGVAHAGAGSDLEAAARPAVGRLPTGGRLLVFGYGMTDSGIPEAWAAGRSRAGVNLLPDSTPHAIARVANDVAAARRPGDLVVLSIHWGPNWSLGVSPEQRAFAKRLVEDAGADVVHGHSSHHVRGVEVHRGRLIVHGCGELINDYERIASRTDYLHDHSLVYLAELDPASGALRGLRMIPTRIRRLQVNVADASGTRAVAEKMSLACEPLGTTVSLRGDGCLELLWR